MDYNKNAAQNVVLYLSHRELILFIRKTLISYRNRLYLSHRELIHYTVRVRGERSLLYLSHRELIL